MIDCTGAFKNKGCGGGFMTNCFNYLKTNKIMTEQAYPFVTKAGKCNYDESKGVTGVSSYVALPANDPNALLQAIQKQPVSIAVAASGNDFYLYKSGVLDT